MFDKTDRIISALTAAGFSIVPAGEVEAVEAGAECMWAEKPCTCGGGPCEQVSFGENHESLLAELIGEHSGCGHGIQNESIPVKLARGDEVYVVRGELGRALIPATGPVKAFTAAPLSARPKGGA
ncbi:hypothetical protein [Pseudaminobacter salicylatoxidans]|nr:hypothetical protein [Pseudaminobacter salicylatoxidans]